MSRHLELADLVAKAVVESGPPPDGIDSETYAIAIVPAGPLSRAARRATPSYEDIIYDQSRGGDLTRQLQEDFNPDIAFGTAVRLRQQELSKPSRRLATIACSVALFLGGGALTNEAFNELDRGVPKQAQANTAQRLGGDALIGGIMGGSGGLIVSFTALGFAGRLARRPAQKIVRKAAKSSTK